MSTQERLLYLFPTGVSSLVIGCSKYLLITMLPMIANANVITKRDIQWISGYTQ